MLPISGVAPFVGAWIEIAVRSPRVVVSRVAPFVGAWIEIDVFGI